MSAPMSIPTISTQRVCKTHELPAYLHHPNFDKSQSLSDFSPEELLDADTDYETKYMPDEVTREHSKRMHYAAFRAHKSRTRRDRQRWLNAYLGLRDRIVLGNRKLIYRAVRRRMALHNRADDMIGDCHIVLIQAVAAFNPWLDIRFSTYAYTCLVRALSRMSQRLSSDWLARALSFDALPDGEPGGKLSEDGGVASSSSFRIDEFLRVSHPLLSEREKTVIARRFSLAEDVPSLTLEQVGKEMGLSKERVRQVQASALSKLRRALQPAGIE